MEVIPDNVLSNELICCQLVSFNNEETIKLCLEHLINLKLAPEFRLVFIILDNNSEDSSREIIDSFFLKHSEIEHYLFFENQNLGFSGGHNKALEKSIELGASYVTLINPDLILDAGAIIELRAGFNAGTKIGAVCPKLYRLDTSELKGTFVENKPGRLIDAAGMYVTPSYRHFDRGSNLSAKDQNGNDRYSYTQYVVGGSGACVMFSKECIDDISFPKEVSDPRRYDLKCKEFLDEDFFAYREDAELSFRMKWKGWKFKYEPSAIGYHVRKVLPSNRSETNSNINALSVQNRFLLQFQTLPISVFLLLSPAILFRNMLVVLGCLIKEQSSLHGMYNAVRLFPKTIKKRRWILSVKRKCSVLSYTAPFYQGDRALNALSASSENKKPNDKIILEEDDFNFKQSTEDHLSLHIAIVNYYQSLTIIRHINSILDSLKSIENCRITIINNSPDDQYFESFRTTYDEHPIIDFIEPGRNLGFASANNLALMKSKAKVYLLMNPDISPIGSMIDDCLDAFVKYKNLACLSPILIDSKSNKIQFSYVAKKFPSLMSLLESLFFLDRITRNNPVSRYERYQDDNNFIETLNSNFEFHLKNLDSSNEKNCYEIEQPAGACLFVSSKVYNALDGLDEGFHPAWYEDVDFAVRVQKKGYVNAINTKAFAYHDGGSSLENLPKSKFLSFYFRNQRVFWKKHSTSIFQYMIASFCISLSYISRRLIAYIASYTKDSHPDSLDKIYHEFCYFLKPLGDKHSKSKFQELEEMNVKQSSIRSYIKNMIKDPSVASIAPTSRFGIQKLLKNIVLANCTLIIEYGPGGGVITKYLLDNMAEDCLLLAVETNETFAEALRQEINDSRLIVRTGSAADIELFVKELYESGRISSPYAQYIVSGIPFSMFSLELKNLILSATKKVLDPDGSFLVYQFLVSLSAGKKDIKNKLSEYFHIFRSEVEFANIPPLRIFEAKHKRKS